MKKIEVFFEIIESKLSKTMKEHKCDYCNKVIEKGCENFLYNKVDFEGGRATNFKTSHFCIECSIKIFDYFKPLLKRKDDELSKFKKPKKPKKIIKTTFVEV